MTRGISSAKKIISADDGFFPKTGIWSFYLGRSKMFYSEKLRCHFKFHRY